MAVRRLAAEQPDAFAFSPETEAKLAFWLAKYPEDRKRSAVIPALWLAQKQAGGWLPEPAIRAVAERLEMPYMRAFEVATFYTMFNLAPVGRHYVQLCGTTPCMLRGAGDLRAALEERVGPQNTVTADGMFSWLEVECLGACVNAPMAQISNADGDWYYEDLTPATLNTLLDDLAAGKSVEAGTRVDRLTSAPEGGALTLNDTALFDGSAAAPVALPNLPGAPDAAPEPAPAPLAQRAARDAGAAAEGEQPEGLDGPRDGGPDDLTKLPGVGPKGAETLQSLGIYHFDQIARFTAANVVWLAGYLNASAKIEPQDWIDTARRLSGVGAQ